MATIYIENNCIEVLETYDEIQDVIGDLKHTWIEVIEKIWIDGSRFKEQKTTIQKSKIVRFTK